MHDSFTYHLISYCHEYYYGMLVSIPSSPELLPQTKLVATTEQNRRSAMNVQENVSLWQLLVKS